MQFWQANLKQHSGFIYDARTESRYSYVDLNEKIEAYISELPKQKQLVAVKANNQFTVLACYLALLRAGHVVLFIDADMAEDKTTYLLKHYKVNYLFDESAFTLLARQNLNLHANLALLLSTSGSTGTAKLVRLSLDNISANAQSICEYLPIKNTDTVVTSLPCHYSFGLSVINTHLSQGASIVLNDYNPMQKEFWQLIKQFKPNGFYGVPFSYELLQRLRLARLPLNSIQYFAQAGGRVAEPLLNELSAWTQEHNKAFFVMYGQTEATARITYLQANKLTNKIGFIGKAIPGGQCWLIDESGNKINEAGKEGELCYKGANVGGGIASNSEDLALFDLSDELKTGDLAFFDSDGDFKIVGRLKRFVKLLGKRINLDEVQAWLEPMLECVVVGNDESIRIYFCDDSIDEKGIKAKLASYLQLHSRYIGCQFIDEIPRLTNGKVDYKRMPT